MTQKIYIVILNFNCWNDTIECIESVLSSVFQDFQIVLIDNKSTNDSESKILSYLNGDIKAEFKNIYFKSKVINRNPKLPFVFYNSSEKALSIDQIIETPFDNNKDVLHSLKHPIIFIQTNKNLGFAGGNNIGLKAILNSKQLYEDSKVLLLNPDTYIDSNALDELQKIGHELFMSSSRINDYYRPQENIFYGAYKLIKPIALLTPIKDQLKDYRIDYIYGAALLTNIKTIKKLGFLPEDYFLYWEETDWCFLAKQKNVKLIISPNSIVYDKGGTSIGRGYLAHYYYIKNGLFFYNKYLKKYLFTLIASNVFRLLNKIRKGEFRNALAIVNGTKDFIKGKKGNQTIS